jgi:non-heme chloroperoxidase
LKSPALALTYLATMHSANSKPHLRSRRALCCLGVLAVALVLASGTPSANAGTTPKSGFVTTPDGVKIHYVEAGKTKVAGAGAVGHPTPTDATVTKGDVALESPHQFTSILFVPGWTMPAWIWDKQIEYFSDDWRVVAMDPRAQGDSSKGATDYSPAARARDIKAVIDHLKLAPVGVIGWSMGVTDIASYVAQFGTGSLAGIVFVDGIAGSDPGQIPKGIQDFIDAMKSDRQKETADFVRSMFRKPQSEEYLARLTKVSLEMPAKAAIDALTAAWAADNRGALARIDKPTLIVGAKGPFVPRYEEMQKRIPNSRIEIFDGVGHALFVDDPDRFDGLLEDFLFDIQQR